jgi:uncharacterized iron-regulated membrane protein
MLMKRLLFLVHRWVGVTLALFMTLWFFSGLSILYSTQMNQTRTQQLAHAEWLFSEAGWLSLGEAWERSAGDRKKAAAAAKGEPSSKEGGKEPGKRAENTITEARLVRHAGQPQWLVEDTSGRRFAVSAIDGSLQETSVESAEKIAENWVNAGNAGHVTPVRFIETVDKPMIIRNQDALRPFHHFAVDDGSGSELYISVRSGEVMHASTRLERGLYWAGNWLHFFRFLDLTNLSEARGEILMWSVIFAFVACLTGLIVGWLRWRPGLFGKATYAEGRVHPYKAFWFRWHFWAGLIGGSFALTWAFSGFITGNTWKLFSPATPSREELVRYYGAGLPSAMRDWKPQALGNDVAETVELGWRRLGDGAVLLAYDRNGQRKPLEAAAQNFGNVALIDAVKRLAGGKHMATQSLQSEYDSYYYLRHGRGSFDRPLPVVRVELDDEAATRFYLDPQDGRLLLRQDNSRRAYRWLFNALHYWDFGPLYVRPFWDAWMLLWIGFGVVLSVSSVFIGWKRLKATFRAKNKKRSAAPKPVPELVTENLGR